MILRTKRVSHAGVNDTQQPRDWLCSCMRLFSSVLLAFVVLCPSTSDAWSSTLFVNPSISERQRPVLPISSDRQSKMMMAALGLQMKQYQQGFPTMFLNQRFGSSATLSLSPPIQHRRNGRIEHNTKQQSRSSIFDDGNRQILGFDVFKLGAASRSNVDLQTWKNGEIRGDEAPGLSWNSKATTISFLPNKLPAWLPWVPTKSQIQSLKLAELKAACSQRGLARVCILALIMMI